MYYKLFYIPLPSIAMFEHDTHAHMSRVCCMCSHIGWTDRFRGGIGPGPYASKFGRRPRGWITDKNKRVQKRRRALMGRCGRPRGKRVATRFFVSWWSESPHTRMGRPHLLSLLISQLDIIHSSWFCGNLATVCCFLLDHYQIIIIQVKRILRFS